MNRVFFWVFLITNVVEHGNLTENLIANTFKMLFNKKLKAWKVLSNVNIHYTFFYIKVNVSRW